MTMNLDNESLGWGEPEEFDIESLNAAMEDIQGSDEVELPDDGGTDTGVEGGEQTDGTGGLSSATQTGAVETGAGTGTEAPAPEVYNIDGTDYPLDVLREYVNFDSFLKANPTAAERMKLAFDPSVQIGNPPPQISQPVQQVIEPVHRPAPTPAPTIELPDDIDTDDPTVKFVLAQQTEINSRLAQLADSQSSVTQYIGQEQQKVTDSLVTSGFQTFVHSHPELAEQDIIAVRDTASQLDTLSALARQGVPIDRATTQALETVMWTIPSVRDKLIAHQHTTNETAAQASAAQAQQDQTRQRKLTAISGGNGSTGRAPAAAPASNMARRFDPAMADAIAQEMQNTQAV